MTHNFGIKFQNLGGYIFPTYENFSLQPICKNIINFKYLRKLIKSYEL